MRKSTTGPGVTIIVVETSGIYFEKNELNPIMKNGNPQLQ